MHKTRFRMSWQTSPTAHSDWIRSGWFKRNWTATTGILEMCRVYIYSLRVGSFEVVSSLIYCEWHSRNWRRFREINKHEVTWIVETSSRYITDVCHTAVYTGTETSTIHLTRALVHRSHHLPKEWLDLAFRQPFLYRWYLGFGSNRICWLWTTLHREKLRSGIQWSEERWRKWPKCFLHSFRVLEFF